MGHAAKTINLRRPWPEISHQQLLHTSRLRSPLLRETGRNLRLEGEIKAMGNWFSRKYLAVHPMDQDGEDIVKSSLITPSSSSLRIKVRMTTTQLEELMALADLSEGSSDLGRVILQECLDGRFRARVVVGDEGLLSSEYARNLYTIKEE